MNVKNLEILANEIQEQISKLKKDEGDIGKLLSLSSSFQEALIIFKYQLSQNISLNDKSVQKFEIALKKLCLNLAKQIVVDGEGAKKFVTINVINAKSLGSAKNIAFSIANSPLVKTAVAGEDPNWGRIAMGIGKSGEIVDTKKLKVKIGNITVAENGRISESYDEEKLKEYMKWDSVEIEVNLKLGNDAFKCFTCDFTHDYIDINADYRN